MPYSLLDWGWAFSLLKKYKNFKIKILKIKIKKFFPRTPTAGQQVCQEPSIAVMSETERKTNQLNRLPTDVILELLSYLTSDIPSLLAFAASSRSCLGHARHERIFGVILSEQLGVSNSDEPPTGDDADVCDVPAKLSVSGQESFYAFLRWKKAFPLYALPLVKRVRRWWLRMESYLSVHYPEIHSSLGPPLSEATISSTLSEDGGYSEFVLPSVLRIMYRFHDGQQLVGQLRMLTESPRTQRFFAKKEVMELGMGLFGGISFYDEMVVMYLLPLRCLSKLNRHSSHYLDTHEFSCTIGSFHCSTGSGASRSSRASDYVLFAVNTLIPNHHSGPIKGYFVDRVMGRRNCVYTNCKGSLPVDHDLVLTSCVSPEARACANDDQCELMLWLEEYASRLERGVYVVEPMKQYSTDVEGQREQADRAKAIYIISHFPRQECTVVTNGVEVSASSVLVTHESSLESDGPDARLFFTYSIRMRLLEDHPSRPPALGSCQLVSRHWRITDSKGAVESVDGPGVVGEFPLLRADRRLTFPFAYQSCTSSLGANSSFAGTLRFRAAASALWPQQSSQLPCNKVDVEDTGGQLVGGDVQFDAVLPTMELDIGHERNKLFQLLF